MNNIHCSRTLCKTILAKKLLPLDGSSHKIEG